MPPLPSVLPITAITRSASRTPSSMSLASSEASLTLCSGTLRTSIGAGIGFLSAGENGAGVVSGDGVGDVLEGRDDGAAAPVVEEPQRGLDLGTHAAAGELAGQGELAQLGGGDPAQRALPRGAEGDDDVGEVGGNNEGVRAELVRQDRGGQVLVDDPLDAAQRMPVLRVVDDRD